MASSHLLVSGLGYTFAFATGKRRCQGEHSNCSYRNDLGHGWKLGASSERRNQVKRRSMTAERSNVQSIAMSSGPKWRDPSNAEDVTQVGEVPRLRSG